MKHVFWLIDLFTSIVETPDFVIMLLFEMINNEGGYAIDFMDVFEWRTMFLEYRCLKIMLMFLLIFRELVVCPYSLPEVCSVKIGLADSFSYMKADGFHIVLICNFSTIGDIRHDVWVKFLEFFGRRPVKVLWV